MTEGTDEDPRLLDHAKRKHLQQTQAGPSMDFEYYDSHEETGSGSLNASAQESMSMPNGSQYTSMSVPETQNASDESNDESAGSGRTSPQLPSTQSKGKQRLLEPSDSEQPEEHRRVKTSKTSTSREASSIAGTAEGATSSMPAQLSSETQGQGKPAERAKSSKTQGGESSKGKVRRSFFPSILQPGPSTPRRSSSTSSQLVSAPRKSSLAPRTGLPSSGREPPPYMMARRR